MIIINSLKEIKNIDKSVVTIGKFDGIHKGHTVLIEKAVDLAKKENLKSIDVYKRQRGNLFTF